jgi:hypothetical protein
MSAINEYIPQKPSGQSRGLGLKAAIQRLEEPTPEMSAKVIEIRYVT